MIPSCLIMHFLLLLIFFRIFLILEILNRRIEDWVLHFLINVGLYHLVLEVDDFLLEEGAFRMLLFLQPFISFLNVHLL